MIGEVGGERLDVDLLDQGSFVGGVPHTALARLRFDFINGIKSMPVAFTEESDGA